jgi:hypothetical protein
VGPGVEIRAIVGVEPSTAVAMRTFIDRPGAQEGSWRKCGEWRLAPSSLLIREQVRELAPRVATPGAFAG